MVVRISSCGNTADNPGGNLNLLAEVKILNKATHKPMRPTPNFCST